MKKFDKLIDAIKFRTHCPLCNDDLYIKENGLIGNYNKENLSQKLTFSVFNTEETVIVVNPFDNSVQVVNNTDDVKNNKLGTFGTPLTIQCNSCDMYSFTIQVWIDLSHQVMIDIILNSESISWEDDKETLHEVTSIYSTNKTKYSYFRTDDIDNIRYSNPITIPLVPIDVNNLEGTVVRIQNLIVFS